MKRVLILGGAGSGKTTFAEKLGNVLNIPVIHLDSHFWQPNWTQPESDTWRKTCKELAQKPAWIMDGNYRNSLDLRLPHADTVIFLESSFLKSLFRVYKRYLQHFGKVRKELAQGCTEKMDWEFFMWIFNYNRKYRPEILKMVREKEHINLHILKNDRAKRRFLKKLERK